MDCNKVISFMEQQHKALNELVDLIAHDEKQASEHSIKPEDIEALRNYVATMKLSVDTALALAKHYKDAQKAGSTTAAEAPTADTKPKRTRKQETQKEEPPAQEPPAQEPIGQEPEAPTQEPETPIEDDFDFLN